MAGAVVSFRRVYPLGIGCPGALVAGLGRLCPRKRGQRERERGAPCPPGLARAGPARGAVQAPH
jgi:hypothetical protein